APPLPASVAECAPLPGYGYPAKAKRLVTWDRVLFAGKTPRDQSLRGPRLRADGLQTRPDRFRVQRTTPVRREELKVVDRRCVGCCERDMSARPRVVG